MPINQNWASILNSQGFYRTLQGQTYLLDEASLEKLRLLETIQPKRKKNEDEVGLKIPRLAIFDWLALRKKGITLNLNPQDERLLNRLLTDSMILVLVGLIYF